MSRLFSPRSPSSPRSTALRVTSAVVAFTHLMSLWPVQVFAQELSTPAPAQRPARIVLPVPPAPVKATVNTTLPKVANEVPPLTFSKDPSDAEFARCRLFAEPLLPIGGKTSSGENRALAAAILDFSTNAAPDHTGGLSLFLAAYPKSAWSVSLLTNLGIIARRGCYWSEALEDWQKAWALGQNETEPTRRLVVDRALGQLAELTARIGHVKELKALLAKVEKRDIRGPATEKIAEARQSLFLMETEPTKSFRCGPLAVGKVWMALYPEKPMPASVFQSVCTDHGTSLPQVQAFAKTLGIDLQMAKRSLGAEVLFPCVVNWKVGHFAAVTRRFESGLYAVKDSTFTDDFSVSVKALDQESTGYFLVRSGELPQGWRPVTETEGSKVWGRGGSSPTKPPTPPCTGLTLGCVCCPGMAGYGIDPSRVNLTLTDTPLFYTPPHGPAMAFTASYSQRDVAPSSTPNYANLGAQWNLNWVSFVVDDPNNATTTTYGPGGGTLTYTNYTSTGANTGSFAGQSLTQAILERTSATSYIKHFPDGSRQVFNLADTSTPTNIFMTEFDDPVGNSVLYTYDPATFRLLSVTDALGQVNTLAYVSNDPATTNGDFYRVASVTDPFGRSAAFSYDASGRLSAITDMGGIVSQFTYGTGNFISTLTTPYGNTTFVSNDVGSDRTLLATDPEGGSEYVWFAYNMAPPDGAGAPSAPGLLTNTSYDNYRTTYYWDKKAYMDGQGDISKAHLYHFLHNTDITSVSDVLESEKSAYESRVFYNYPGQTTAYVSSDNNLPSMIARVLDDGSTQLMQFAYNPQGMKTQAITPSNGTTPARTTTWTYAANGEDLLSVYQENPTGLSVDSFGVASDILASFTYDALGKHLVLTATDASAQTTTFTYNSYGQPLTITDALNETTTFTYDRDQDGDGVSDGYLTTVVGPVAAATANFAYDGFGRLYQSTDSEGYTKTITYDAIGGVVTRTLNRVAQVTYPDATFDQVLYYRLDPQWKQDRLGRWTELVYDNMRRLSVVVDPLNRTTQYQWCVCGSLEAIIDPAGNKTSWSQDAQRRIIQKTYPDGSAVVFNYENSTSRQKSVLDAKGQQTNYQYNIDDTLSQVTYTDPTGNALVPPTPSVSFTYDTAYPRPLTMTDGIGVTQYAYNPVASPPALGANRVSSVAAPWANDTITFTYDQLGRVLSCSINGAINTTSVVFDSLGRATNVTNPLGAFTSTYVDATARPLLLSAPNGQTTQFLYFPNTGDQRLQEIKNLSNTGSLLSQFDYTYNAVGDVTTWTQNNPTLANPRQYTFGYDAADQLISAQLKDTVTSVVQSDQAYGYDAANNRVTTQNGSTVATEQPNNLNQLTQTMGGGMMRFYGTVSKSATVTVGGNPATVNPDNSFQGYAQVSATAPTTVHIVATDSSNNVTDDYVTVPAGSVAPTALTYDINGNTLSSGPAGAPNVTYGWDAADRLVTITQGANVTTFDYDGMGRRVRESLNGTEVRHWIWNGTELCEERDASNAVTKRFFPQGEQIGATNYFYTLDHLGSIREMTDSANVIHARYDYDNYGLRSANQVTVTPVDSDFGFTGHYFHPASGLYLAPFRAYNPNTARWLSRDPIEENGGLNLYAYVLNQPMSLIDPSGLIAYAGYAAGAANPTSDINAFHDRAVLGAGERHTFPFSSPDSLLSALESSPNITRLDIHGHGVVGRCLTGDANHRIFPADLSLLAEEIASGAIDVARGARIRFFNCNQDSNAKYLSQELTRLGRGDISVTGANEHVYPSGDGQSGRVDNGGVFNTYRGGNLGGSSRSMPYNGR